VLVALAALAQAALRAIDDRRLTSESAELEADDRSVPHCPFHRSESMKGWAATRRHEGGSSIPRSEVGADRGRRS
jgi:hypothetical protein